MQNFQEKYVNLFTDFGFKKIFGEEPNKDLLLDFLNELLKEEQGNIIDLTYIKNDNLGDTDIDRRAIFDLYCENEKGEKFIVELQKSKQNFFKDRTVYYSTFPIPDQAQKGNWNYELKAVYTIAILDFIFDEDKEEPEKYRYDVKLTDVETKKIFYNKLTFIYLEMPKFDKKLEMITSRFEKWMYVIKNLNRLDMLPETLREQVFSKLFESAEIARFTPAQVKSYEDSLKYYRDLKNSLDTAREEGFEEGFVEGIEQGKQEGFVEGIEQGKQEGFVEGVEQGMLKEKIEIAKRLLTKALTIEEIEELTGLSKEDIKNIKVK